MEVYWFASQNWIEILLGVFLWIAICLGWAIGGLLLTRTMFKLEAHEGFLTGLGVGLIQYLWLCNVIGRFLPKELLFVVPALLVLIIGFLVGRTHLREILPRRTDIILLVVIALMTFVFILFSRSITLFDESKNLSVIALIASGKVPPPSYMRATYPMATHYGFHTFAAALAYYLKLHSWSAWDVGKSIITSYSIVLVGMAVYRFTKNRLSAICGGITFLFVTGTRYLLLLFPEGVIDWLGRGITVKYDDRPLYQILHGTYTSTKSMVASWDFGFLNGTWNWSYFVYMNAGTFVFHIFCFALAILLMTRIRNYIGAITFAMILSFWALAWEVGYALFVPALFLVVVVSVLQKKTSSPLWFAFWGILFSIPMVLLQGGVITEYLRHYLIVPDSSAASNNPAFLLFYDSPILPNRDFYNLSLFTLQGILAGLFEIGPLVLWIPVILLRGFRDRSEFRPIFLSSLIASIAAWMLVLFTQYWVGNDVIKIPEFSLYLFMFLLLVYLWSTPWKKPRLVLGLGLATLLLHTTAGVYNGYILSKSIGQPVFSDYINVQDARVAAQIRGKMDETAWVFDPEGWRAIALTGLGTNASPGSKYERLPEWEALYRMPTIEGFHDQNFRYVYVDEAWVKAVIRKMPNDFREDACVVKIGESISSDRTIVRQLFDLQRCTE